MDIDFTTKAQDALGAADASSGRQRQCRCGAGTPARRTLGPGRGIATALLDAVGADRRVLAAAVSAELAKLPSAAGQTVGTPGLDRAMYAVLQAAQDLAKSRGDAIRLHRAPAARAVVGRRHRVSDLLASSGASTEALMAARCRRCAGRESHEPRPGGVVPGAGEVRHRPHQTRRRGQDRPGHRPRLRDSSGGAGALPAHQNNPVLIGEPGVGKTAVVEGWPAASSRATCPSRCGASR